MDATDWLDRYLTPDSGAPAWESVHHAPGGWAFVTDERSFLAVRADPRPDWRSLELHPGLRVAVTLHLLEAPPPADAARTTLADLWAWLDCLTRTRCEVCEGTSLPCPDCDDRGWYVGVPSGQCRNVVCFGGHPFDRDRLVWWLPGELPDGPCDLWLEPLGRDNGPVWLAAGDGWRAGTAALYRKPPGRCRAYHPGAGGWWPYRNDPVSRLAATDWAQDRDIDPFDLVGGPATLPTGEPT